MKRYETVVIWRGGASEQDQKDVQGRIEKILQAQKGKWVDQQSLGKKPLAYPIRKEREGIYWLIQYEGDGETVPQIEHLLRYDERVVRFMTSTVAARK